MGVCDAMEDVADEADGCLEYFGPPLDFTDNAESDPPPHYTKVDNFGPPQDNYQYRQLRPT